jgi:hypothetical protein
LERLRQIAVKVKSIRHLNGLRRTTSRTFGISASAITADHLDAGMSRSHFANVSDSRSGRRSNCAVAMAAAPGPIIHPENFDITDVFCTA